MSGRPVDEFTVGSLFAGIGGFDLGFTRAGFRVEWQVEIDPWCRRVLAKHWPDTRRWPDVRTFPPDPSDEWPGGSVVDVVVGGDPCQGNSNAGSVYKREHEDLGREFVRIVDVLRPRVVVRENPYPSRPGALWPWWRMRAELERLGYAVLPFRLRSCCLGAHHRRDRVFLLGEFPDPDGDGLEGVHGEGFPSRHTRGVCRDGGGAGGREHGLPAPRVCRSRDEVPHLVDRLRGLGNAVDPVVAEWIAGRVMAAMGRGMGGRT